MIQQVDKVNHACPSGRTNGSCCRKDDGAKQTPTTVTQQYQHDGECRISLSGTYTIDYTEYDL